jgi:hypothetical protein
VLYGALCRLALTTLFASGTSITARGEDAADLLRIQAIGDLAVKDGAARYEVDDTAHDLTVYNRSQPRTAAQPLLSRRDMEKLYGKADGDKLFDLNSDPDRIARSIESTNAYATATWACAEGNAWASLHGPWEHTWTVRVFVEGQTQTEASCKIPGTRPR